jgi:hypothetical protein
MRELVRGKNTIGPEDIDPGGHSVEKPREMTLTFKLAISFNLTKSSPGHTEPY